MSAYKCLSVTDVISEFQDGFYFEFVIPLVRSSTHFGHQGRELFSSGSPLGLINCEHPGSVDYMCKFCYHAVNCVNTSYTDAGGGGGGGFFFFFFFF